MPWRRINRWLAGLDLPVRTLRSHVVLVVLVALLPSLATTVATGAAAARRSRDMAEQRLRETSGNLARAVDRESGLVELVLMGLASSLPVEPNGYRLSMAARSVAAQFGARIGIYSPAGALLAETMPDPGGAQPLALTKTFPEILPPIPARMITDIPGDNPRVTGRAILAVPVLLDGRPAAWLATMLTRSRLADVLAPSIGQPGRLAAVVDRAGRLIASVPPFDPETTRLLAGAGQGDGSAGDRPLPVLIAGRLRLVSRAAIERTPGWQVVYGEDAAAISPDLAAPQLNGLLAGIAAGCVSLVLAWLLGSRLAGPLRLLTAQARAVAIGGDRPPDQSRPSTVMEFEALRLAMARADAVLRRRGAAERMALREARTGHELLASVVNATAEHIVVKDLDLRCVLVNRALLTASEPPLDEWQVLGRSSAELLPADAAGRIEAIDRAVLSTGRMTSFEMEVPRDDGTAQWRWITTTPWKDAAGQVVGVVTVSRDVTDRRAAEARLRMLQADLLRATRLSAMGAMASGLAHELNQPLAAATNYLNASGRLLDKGLGVAVGPLQGGRPAQIAAAREAVADSARQLLRAGSIVRRLRDFVGRGEAELEPEEVGGLIDDACDLARRDGLPDHVFLRVALSPAAPGGHSIVLADRTQIQQVLLNLMRNAAEAMVSHGARDAGGLLGPLGMPGHDGEIVIAVAEPDGRSMTITISDNGPGIPPEIAERLFQPFVSTKPTGMGIGLVICHTIIQGHGGQLVHERDASDAADRGSMFHISLPIPQPAGEPEWMLT